jgi:hypothetical protein
MLVRAEAVIHIKAPHQTSLPLALLVPELAAVQVHREDQVASFCDISAR